MQDASPGPDFVTIETPEHVIFHYEIAGLMSRALAAFLDHLLQAFVIVGIAAAAVFGGAFAGLAGGGEQLNFLSGALVLLGIFVAVWGYFVLFEILWRGQTPGKRIVGIRVIREGGYAVTPGAVLVRNLLRFVADLGPLYPVGIVVMFLNRRSKRAGDYAAGTMVIRDAAWQPPPAAMPSLTAGRGEDPAVDELRRAGIHRLRPEAVKLVEAFLARRRQLDPVSRRSTAAAIARPLAEALGTPLGDPERFLQHVFASLRKEGL